MNKHTDLREVVLHKLSLLENPQWSKEEVADRIISATLDQIKAELPEQYDNYTGTDMEDYQKGHNEAIDQVLTILERFKV